MTGWTEERVTLVSELWVAGYSAAHIAERLSVTRNAVIGKVHRLDLPRRKMPSLRRAELPSKSRVERLRGDRLRSKENRSVKPGKPAPPELWDGPCISMLDDKLSHFMCREIVRGSGVDTMFCGAPTVPGSQFSYCAFHASKNLRLATRKEDRPRFVPYRVAA